jgi:hypothetical protein
MMPLQVGSSTEDKAFARVRVAGLDTEGLVARGDAPDWLLERGNTVLALEGMPLPRFIPGPYTEGIATGGVAVLRSPGDYRVMLWGEGPLVSVGSHSCLDYGELRCGSGEIHISPQFTAAGGMEIDARNGGCVKIGKQSQCGPRVMILTDDMHTIRDMHSGKRVNPYGGRVVIGERVWIPWLRECCRPIASVLASQLVQLGQKLFGSMLMFPNEFGRNNDFRALICQRNRALIRPYRSDSP